MSHNWLNNITLRVNSNSIHYKIQEKVVTDNLETTKVLTPGRTKHNFKITDKRNLRQVLSEF